MLRLFSIVLLAAAINGQTTPDCSQRPTVHPPECCPGAFAKFMTKEAVTACNLPAEMADPPTEGRQRGPPPGGPLSCDAVNCLLKNNNVLGSDGKIDKSALTKFMEGGLTAEWKPAIQSTVNECTSIDTSSSNCPNDAVVHCLKMSLIKNCPASIWVSSDDCAAMKAHITQCPFKGKP